MDWYLPGTERRFATTTVATSLLVLLVSEEGLSVAESILRILYDAEARAVLQHMADNGLADVPLATLVG